jgi:hypothetical protein
MPATGRDQCMLKIDTNQKSLARNLSLNGSNDNETVVANNGLKKFAYVIHVVRYVGLKRCPQHSCCTERRLYIFWRSIYR